MTIRPRARVAPLRASLAASLTGLLAGLLAAPICAQTAGDLSDTQPIASWKKLAHGVHVAVLGEPAHEVRYSDLAGAPPRIETLNSLSDAPLCRALAAARWRADGDGRLSVRIPTEPGEQIFGYGLQFDRTLHSGRILELKVDHFERGGGRTHAPVPFFLSSAGYGVLFNTARYLEVYNQVGNRKDSPNNPAEVDRNPPPDEEQPGPWLAQPPGDAVEASLRARGLELVGFTGDSLLDVVARYNLFSGGGALPPLWGLGFWHRTPSQYSAAEVEAEVAEFDRRGIPLDVIGLEPGWQTKSYPCTYEWQRKRFPDPAAFTRGLLEAGVRINLWENPYVSQHAGLYDALRPLSGSHLVWLGIVPDYTLPAARRALVEQHRREHLALGVSGYKIDEVDGYDHWLWPDHATFPSGTPAETMRQTYGMVMQQMLQKELFEAHDQRTYSLVRATNGAASAYPFVLYSDSYAHAQYITGLSSASLAGLLWCPEIRSAGSEREWINRMHTVCLSPLAQLNAWASGTQPWSYPRATDAVRRTIELRMRLLPYLYSAFADYHFDGVPPIRSLILGAGRPTRRRDGSGAAPDAGGLPAAGDASGRITEDNTLFCFGPDLLAAPFEGEAAAREVHLPVGDWYDFYTGEPVGNGVTITVTAADTHDLPPLFARDGALIPLLAQPIRRTREVRGAALEVRHYGARPGSCRLYEDDTTTFAFARGAYRWRELSVRAGQLEERSGGGTGPALYGELTLREMTPGD